MIRLDILASVQEIVFVDIGVAANLQGRVSGKIGDNHVRGRPCSEDRCLLNHATKNAAMTGWQLEVSWAAVSSHESAKNHEAALLRAYFAANGRLPAFRVPKSGAWIRGNVQHLKREEPVGKLKWSPWTPFLGADVKAIPTEPGVYRIRAVPPGG